MAADDLPAEELEGGAQLSEGANRSGRQSNEASTKDMADALRERLSDLGWDIRIRPVGWRFFYADGGRTQGSRSG